MNRRYTSLLGWYGVLAILGAYALLNFRVLDADSLTYQLLNLTGSLGFIVETWTRRDYQPMVLNLAWALIALIVLFSTVFSLT